jgi:PAS domain S-box-containing protein
MSSKEGASGDRGSRVLLELATQITEAVGDGCVVRALDRSGRLAAVAADHRDPDRRNELRLTLTQEPLPQPSGWLGQAMARHLPVRLPQIEPGSVRAAGLPFDERLRDVVFVPVGRFAVIEAVRDRAPAAYSALDRRELESLAADAASQLNGDSHTLADGASLIDASAAAIWVTDSDGVTLEANQRATELVGLPAERLVGVPFVEFLDHDRSAPAADFLGENPAERRLISGDGVMRWVEAAARPRFDSRGRPAGAVITLVDVDERHRREVRLRTRLDSERALTEFAELLLREDDRDRVLSRAAQLVAEQLDAMLVALVLCSGDGNEVSTLAAAGPYPKQHPESLGDRQRLSARTPTLVAIHSRETVVVPDFDRDSTYVPGPISIAAGARSVACVPVDDGLGCIGVMSSAPEGLAEDEVGMVERLARLLSGRLSSR